MATKCIVLGQDTDKKKELKPIELKECLQQFSGDWITLSEGNEKYDFFQLNPTYTIKGMQVITAKSKVGRYEIWLGYWNDGVA